MERTFAMIKPGGIQRNLVGEIIKRIEEKGLMINAIKMINVTEYQAKKHYDVHENKPFFQELVNYIMSSPVIIMVISGNRAVEILRLLAGATDPSKAQPGTIRGDYSSDMRYNIIHTSDAIDRAKYEISIYFDEKEILEYNKSLNKDIYSE